MYMMVLYEYDGNDIKNRNTAEILRAFQAMEQKLDARGLTLRLARLDNEASQLLNNYLYEQDIIFRLVAS
jgi:hypothetical protein